MKDWQVCADCHDGESSLIFAGTHARLPKTKGLEGCETCHGPALPHADEQEPSQITHPAKLSAKAQRALCSRCHEQQLREHGGPLATLLAADKKCSDCHAIHEHRAQRPANAEKRSFSDRASLAAAAEPVGTETCLGCHADKAEQSLGGTHRRFFEGAEAADGKKPARAEACERCHGNGELHVKTFGIARLILHPAKAADANATCIECHEGVDPVSFHWKPGEKLLKGATRCTDCHEVHGGEDGVHGDPTRQRPAERRPASRPAPRDEGEHPLTRVELRKELAHALDAKVTNADCARCHAGAHGALRGTVHEALGRFDAAEGAGCVQCHPGGGAHAQNGGAPGLVESLHGSSLAVQQAVCLDCHAKDTQVCAHSLGVHAKHDVTCLHCHSPAAGSSKAARLADANKNCTQCHQQVGLSFRRAHAHPVSRGEMQCSSCHDAHGQGRITPQSARRMSQACAECHREQRGPFVFGHHADKGEGCLACHTPHGSMNPQLLKTRTARDLCLPCHADLPSFHDQSPGSKFRNCLDCHTKIHGSNRNRYFLK